MRTIPFTTRLSPFTYALLLRAASMRGQGLSEFAIQCAEQTAQTLVDWQTLMTLDQQDQNQLVRLLMYTPAQDTPLLPKILRGLRRRQGT